MVAGLLFAEVCVKLPNNGGVLSTIELQDIYAASGNEVRSYLTSKMYRYAEHRFHAFFRRFSFPRHPMGTTHLMFRRILSAL